MEVLVLQVPCDWNTYALPSPNPNVIVGALVGGPSAGSVSSQCLCLCCDYYMHSP
jgi:hypothetical protein